MMDMTRLMMLGLMACFASGCGNETPMPNTPLLLGDAAGDGRAGHDHHGHQQHLHGHGQPAMTFQAAVEQTAGMRDVIRAGFASQDPAAAHGPLHSVGRLLSQMETLAQKEGLQGERLSRVSQAVTVLKERFGAVDRMMHGGDGAQYSEVSDDIDIALATLAAESGLPADPPADSPGSDGTVDGDQGRGLSRD